MSGGNVALIAGVSGIIGVNLAQHLLGTNTTKKWTKVYGLSRRKPDFLPEGLEHIPCDLQDQSDAKAKLGQLNDVTHVFCSIWLNLGNEEDNVKVNGAMIKNLLDPLTCQLKHVALVTGGKHYLGPFEMFGSPEGGDGKVVVPTPFKERLDRLPYPNFYYAQEDAVFDQAAKKNFTWSVARPSIIIGSAPSNQMNMGTTLAVYATLCKYTKEPFVFPGTANALDVFGDCTETQLLSEHLEWAATTPAAKNQAFNATNGDLFRWRFLWQEIAKHFGLEVGKYEGTPIDMTEYVQNHSAVWDEIVQKNGLKPYKLSEVLHGWFANSVMSLDFSFMMDMNKAREAGFLKSQDTEKAYLSLFEKLRVDRIIP